MNEFVNIVLEKLSLKFVGAWPLEPSEVSTRQVSLTEPEPKTARAEAWNAIVPLRQSGAIKPILAKSFPLAEAADALRYLSRPAGSSSQSETVIR